MSRKVVIIGPESTGKSTLCKGLANYYGTEWVPEYARGWLLRHGKDYVYEDLLTIAKGQLEGEEAVRSPGPVFIDTDLYVMKVWSEFVFGRCDPWILEQIAERHYDLYLLCDTDLPWVQDELREYPDPATREKLFHIYKDHLVHQSTPWEEIRGNDGERLQSAIRAVNKHMALP